MIVLPSPSTPFLLPDGTINPVWFRVLKAIADQLNAG